MRALANASAVPLFFARTEWNPALPGCAAGTAALGPVEGRVVVGETEQGTEVAEALRRTPDGEADTGELRDARCRIAADSQACGERMKMCFNGYPSLLFPDRGIDFPVCAAERFPATAMAGKGERDIRV
ncbi:hypothetical protein [Planobispora takensis]|uniref:Uncharacterized protein n=1 Tax=Planobispora takensis TaxID=1367882 RepID=A0A8J3WUQ6_9ACTN|nr:hypothetical protein [Planobispora takensis]GII01838.1 hypothetical protein Pta02_38460 [Planobispora takensis]